MVLVETDGVDVKRIPFLETLHGRAHYLLHSIVEQGLSIFHSQLDVIVAFRDVVVPVPETVMGFDIRSSHPFYCTLFPPFIPAHKRRVFWRWS